MAKVLQRQPMGRRKAAARATGNGKGGQAGASSGGAAAGSASVAKLVKEQVQKINLAQMIKDQLKKEAEQAEAAAKKYRKCSLCGDERCFANRMGCHKCQRPRAPPGIKDAEAVKGKDKEGDQDMKAEALPTLEAKILLLEADIKHLKHLQS